MYVIKSNDGYYLTKSDAFGFDDGWAWCEILVDRDPEYAPYIWTNIEECYEIQQSYAKDAKVMTLQIKDLRV